jgi:hypothetical protein
MRASDQAEFLFGKEVKTYLESLRDNLMRHQHAETTMGMSEDEERSRAIQEKHEAFRTISTVFPAMLSPYARMDQKLPFWRVKRIHDWCRAKLKFRLRKKITSGYIDAAVQLSRTLSKKNSIFCRRKRRLPPPVLKRKVGKI